MSLIDSTGSFTKPQNGAVTILNGDDVLYSPNPEFCGTDMFTYTINDSFNNSDTATVTIEVVCDDVDKPIASSTDATVTATSTDGATVQVNHTPVANDDEVSTPEDQPVFINVASNDKDDENDALTVTDVADCKEGGTLVIIGDGTGGVVEYTPAPGFHGMDHCDYTICNESSNCATACVIITVEKLSVPPLAVNDAASTTMNTAIEIEVTGNDISPNGSPLTIMNVGESEMAGLVAIVGKGTSGFVLYEPPSDYIGKDEFNYTSEFLSRCV